MNVLQLLRQQEKWPNSQITSCKNCAEYGRPSMPSVGVDMVAVVANGKCRLLVEPGLWLPRSGGGKRGERRSKGRRQRDMRRTNGGHALKDATVEFFCEEEQEGINLVSIADLKFIPRIGETVLLPGPEKDSTPELYEVTAVRYNFYPDMAGELPSEARLSSINVIVKRVS